MKNHFFREESEIRLCEFSPKQFLMGREVKLSQGACLHNYSYYVRENQLISYVDFDFSDCFEKLIREVVRAEMPDVTEGYGVLSGYTGPFGLSGK